MSYKMGAFTMFRSMTRRSGLKAVLTAAVAVAAVLSAAPAAQADTLANVKAAGVLKVATEMQFPPFDMIEGETYKGIDRELIDEVAKEMGVKADYLDLPWTSVLPGLEAKKFDLVIAPVTITKERMARYAFTIPISEATAALMKRAGDSSITKPEDINGKKVGGGKGTSQLAQIKEFAAAKGLKVEFKEYVDSNQSYAELAAGRVDASVNSLPNLSYAAAQRSDTFSVVLPPFGKPTYFSWVGRKGDEDASLIAAVNEALTKINKDGRMAAIHKKWLGATSELPTTVPEPSF